MVWTDDRVATLESMWLSGYTASEIAAELGAVSRNAVIGKAHRLGLPPTSPVTPAMLGRITELPLSNRIKTTLANDNMIFVGDLVQKSEIDLLRMPNFGRKALESVKSALATAGLRLGMWLTNWPPQDFERELTKWEAARRVADLSQARGGATFRPADDHFAMVAEGDEDDLTAALKPMSRQMQSVLLQKTRNFAAMTARLDNQPGWSGISRASFTLAELLDRRPEEIPDVLGFLYPAAIELGSFVEFDQQLGIGLDSYAEPLDAEVRRPLSDLVRNLAPWLRGFPSVREADDEASRFLVQTAALTPTFDIVKTAGEHALLNDADLEVFRQLHDASERGTFQGEKAGGRAKRSASNFVIGMAAFAGSFFTGAVASDVATTSPLVHRVGQFLVSAEKTIESLIEDLPQDLRYSISEFVKELPQHPTTLPQSPKFIEPVNAPPRPTKPPLNT